MLDIGYWNIRDLKFEKSFDGTFDTFFMRLGTKREVFAVGSNESGTFKIGNYKDFRNEFELIKLEQFLAEQFRINNKI